VNFQDNYINKEFTKEENSKKISKDQNLNCNSNSKNTENFFEEEISSLYKSNLLKITKNENKDNFPFHQSIERLETVIFIKEIY